MINTQPLDGPDQFPWYLAYTKPRNESVAAQQLERQGYAAYLPLYKTLRRAPGGMVVQRGPMFPRYVFFRPGRAGQSIAPVRSTVGVSGIVRFGVAPATVSAELVASLRAFELDREQADPADGARLQAGRRVTICAGPLKGLEGLVSSVAGRRVTVLLEFLGQPQQVAMESLELDAIDA